MEFSPSVEQLVNQALCAPTDSSLTAEAVRQSMDFFAKQNPGRSVEVRVPPYRVVQILGGSTHRRGTPPAVVEMSALTWLQLISGEITWVDGQNSGLIQASGVGSNLATLFEAVS